MTRRPWHGLEQPGKQRQSSAPHLISRSAPPPSASLTAGFRAYWDGGMDPYLPHSITSSARARIAGGIVRPSAPAVLRLTARSNLVGGSTGRSAGLAPLRL